MRESLFVDSCAWLAFFSRRDGMHARADHLMRAAYARKVPLFTSNLVISEVHRLLLHRAGISPAAAALKVIDDSRAVSVKFADPGIHREARVWLEKFDDQVITYTDACSFALMTELRCTAAFSFDSDFTIAGFSLWGG